METVLTYIYCAGAVVTTIRVYRRNWRRVGRIEGSRRGILAGLWWPIALPWTLMFDPRPVEPDDD